MSEGPPLDVRIVDRIRAHLESPDLLDVAIGEAGEVLDFLARLSMEHVEALVRDALAADELRRFLSVIEHRKGLLADHELPAPEARGRIELVESLRRIAEGRRGAS